MLSELAIKSNMIYFNQSISSDRDRPLKEINYNFSYQIQTLNLYNSYNIYMYTQIIRIIITLVGAFIKTICKALWLFKTENGNRN